MQAPVLDYGTGAQAAFAIASALFRRERTGEEILQDLGYDTDMIAALRRDGIV